MKTILNLLTLLFWLSVVCGAVLLQNSQLHATNIFTPPAENDPPTVLIVGGHDHHDFDRWFNQEDSAIIAETGASVSYTDDPGTILPQLAGLDILYLSNNQPLPDPELQRAIHDFVGAGSGLMVVHAAGWYIWQDAWPEYYRDFVGGGTRSHPPLGEFEVVVTDPDHPLMEGVPERFTITDELYRFQRDEDAAEMHVLAKGIEAETGDEYPVAWTVDYGDGRVVNITLGHDGDAHQHPAYRAMLQNSIQWLTQNASN